jgi:hypothetical protein
MEANAPGATNPPQHRRKRPRSPSYPGIGLQQALERARTLYDHERQNAAPVDAILHHWGYKPKSGAGLVALAALKKFGLLTDEGSGDARRGRLTDLALDILLDPRDDSEQRIVAIKRAALEPGIHKELVERYPAGLPSDENLRFFLTRERAFTEAAARELIAELRSTLAFAGLTGPTDTLSRQEPDTQPDEENGGMAGATAETQQQQRRATTTRVQTPGGFQGQPQQRSVQLPVPGGSWVTVQGDFPMTQDAWDSMMVMLDAMKPGLVAPDSDE